MTKGQYRTLHFIRQFIESNGYSPSMRDVAAGTQTTLSNAHRLIATLERDGHIKRERGRIANAGAHASSLGDATFEQLVQELGRRGWFVVNKQELTVAQIEAKNMPHVKTA